MIWFAKKFSQMFLIVWLTKTFCQISLLIAWLNKKGLFGCPFGYELPLMTSFSWMLKSQFSQLLIPSCFHEMFFLPFTTFSSWDPFAMSSPILGGCICLYHWMGFQKHYFSSNWYFQIFCPPKKFWFWPAAQDNLCLIKIPRFNAEI